MTTHKVDPERIEPGQWAHFECPEEGCTFHFWHKWQPAAGGTYFGDSHCMRHNQYPGVVMVIVEVNDGGPPGFDPTAKTGFEHHLREDGDDDKDSAVVVSPRSKAKPRRDGGRGRAGRKKGAK